MLQLWIRDKVHSGGLLTFDLREVPRALGPGATDWLWVVSDVEEADGIDQVVWGEFRAYRDEGTAEPLVRVVALDGSCYEGWPEDAALIGRVEASFSDTTLNSPPVP